MNTNIIHAIVHIQNWGESSGVMEALVRSKNVISVFHVMGRASYLVDVNFDSKAELEVWINQVKAIRLASGVPAIIAIRTQKVIEAHKQKRGFDLASYRNLGRMFHFFLNIDVPHHDEETVALLQGSDIVHTVLHVQGEHSFVAEIITERYDAYKSLLKSLKGAGGVNHLETQEVIAVHKYRNQVFDETGNLTYPREDIREMFSL